MNGYCTTSDVHVNTAYPVRVGWHTMNAETDTSYPGKLFQYECVTFISSCVDP